MRDYDADNERFKECNHNHDDDNKDYKFIMPLLSGIISLGLVLVLGSFGYTWSQSKADHEEKRDWRQEHQRALDKRLDELKHGQEKLGDIVNRNIDDTKFMLQKILDEQKRTNDSIKSNDKHNK